MKNRRLKNEDSKHEQLLHKNNRAPRLYNTHTILSRSGGVLTYRLKANKKAYQAVKEVSGTSDGPAQILIRFKESNDVETR